MNDRLNKMKGILEAQVKAEPRNAYAWRCWWRKDNLMNN